MVSQEPGAKLGTVCAYTGSDLSEVLAISITDMHDGHYGWFQESGEVLVRVGGNTQAAYLDFGPNGEKLQLGKEFAKGSLKRRQEMPRGALDEEALRDQRHKRLFQLPPLLIEVGSYCGLLRGARHVLVDGHFYACVAMCGISLERFQRDKAKPYGATRKHKLYQVRDMLRKNGALSPKTLDLCKKMAGLRNKYAHGEHGLKPKEDALRALKWMHRFIDTETSLMRGYVIENGKLTREHTETT